MNVAIAEPAALPLCARRLLRIGIQPSCQRSSDCWRCFLHLAAPTNPPKPVQILEAAFGASDLRSPASSSAVSYRRAGEPFGCPGIGKPLGTKSCGTAFLGRGIRTLLSKATEYVDAARTGNAAPVGDGHPSPWAAPETTPADRMAIVRHLIESVEVTVQDRANVSKWPSNGSVVSLVITKCCARCDVSNKWLTTSSSCPELPNCTMRVTRRKRLHENSRGRVAFAEKTTATHCRHDQTLAQGETPRSTPALRTTLHECSASERVVARRFGSSARYASSDPIRMGPGATGFGLANCPTRPAVGGMGRPRRDRTASPSPSNTDQRKTAARRPRV